LAERKINPPLPLPQPPSIKLAWKVYWTVHSPHQIQLEKKKSSPPTSQPQNQNLKRKKPRHPESMIALPIGWMKFLSSKGFITIFRLGYYP